MRFQNAISPHCEVLIAIYFENSFFALATNNEMTADFEWLDMVELFNPLRVSF